MSQREQVELELLRRSLGTGYVTLAQYNILAGRVTNNEADIATLQTDLNTAEGDIVTNASAITVLQGRVLDTQIVVRQASDLAGTLDSTKIYYIDGAIDMGSQSIEVPTGGLTIEGAGYDVSVLYSTATNATIFTSPSGSYSGNFNLAFCTVYATGTGARIFDLDNAGNFGAIELITVNLGTFGAAGTETTSLGELTAYRQAFLTGCAIIRCLDGLTTSGTWLGGLTIIDSILLNIGAGVTVFKDGTSFLVSGALRSNINALSVNATTTSFDYAPANFTADAGFALTGARFGGTDPIPNMPVGNTKRYFRECSGVTNTFAGGYWSVTTAASTTLTVSTPAKLLGTTTYSDLIWFSGAASNAFQLDSTVVGDYRVQANLEISGTKNDALNLIVRVYDASAAGYVDIRTFSRTINDIGGSSADVAFFNFETFIPNLAYQDRIELWIENVTAGNAVELVVGGTMSVSTRTS